ncbi:hydrogenase subunit MbhD domain-containing protein [Vreelandella massiliensis]|uniref:hydrogenase subunit MbhD domain-containing protein n=1 Tax=Vreelandella massiliensis TaxID=1816686 RepID=UPI0009FB09CB|nr:hydrogenase subunit MbhD domain-containing protein [Halomonas massiliensis]
MLTPSLYSVETVLALMLIGASWATLFDRLLLRACVMFVVFALALTLAWWLLEAPWLALAELLLGAVLTPAALFYALGVLPLGSPLLPKRDWRVETWPHAGVRVLLALGWLVLLLLALYTLTPTFSDVFEESPLMVAGAIMVASGLGAFALHRHSLRRLLAFNVLGSGVFLLLAGLAGTLIKAQALIMVGLLVAWLGTLLGSLLIRRIYWLQGQRSLTGGGEREAG